ncbi:MAG: hypothetical protein ABI594_21890, partial [Ginsengibacter sp.]
MHITKIIIGLLIVAISTLDSCITTNNFLTNDLAAGFTLEVTKNNNIPRHYRKILIASSGTSSNRLFFDNLYEALSADLLKENVSTQKQFHGNDSVNAFYISDNFGQALAYDAVLTVSPKSINYVSEKNSISPGQANQFEHIFKFAIFEKPGQNNSIWELSLVINVDFT